MGLREEGMGALETERRRREWECVREVDMGIGDQEKRKNRK